MKFHFMQIKNDSLEEGDRFYGGNYAPSCLIFEASLDF